MVVTQLNGLSSQSLENKLPLSQPGPAFTRVKQLEIMTPNLP